MVFTYAGVSLLVYGCGVYQHPQFYDKDLDKYQVLPRPYLGSFDGDNGENHERKMGVLGRSSRNICLGMY